MAWWTLYKRELGSYFSSAVAYIVLFGCAVVQGVLFWFLASAIQESNYKDQSVMQVFFTWPFFWMLIVVAVPLLTMRVFSEEFKLGTIEMLLTAPVGEWDVVIAKFLGALTFFLIIWVPIVLDLTALQIFSNPAPPIYWSQIGMVALTLVLVGAFLTSIGVFTSVLTRNQIVAAVLSFAIIIVFFGISLARFLEHINDSLMTAIAYLSMQEHFQNAVLGIFDSRPVVFYVTITFFMLLLTKGILESRRLKS